MDFRKAPHPSLLTWTPPTGNGKSKTVHATYQGRKLLFQTPRCRCRIFRDASTSLYLYFDDTELQAEFKAFVEDMETYASQMMDRFDVHVECSSCIRQGRSMRLNIWENTDWFDRNGMKISSDVPLDGCSCLIELKGCWVSSRSWGLKWNVLQIKQEEPPARDLAIVDEPTTMLESYSFLDD